MGCRKQQQYTEGHTGRKPEGKKTNICILIPFSHLLFAPPYFLPYCQCIPDLWMIYMKDSKSNAKKRSADFADPHLQMALLFSFQGPPNVSRTGNSVNFKPCFFVYPHKIMFASHS
ncbi:hypothetical protein DXA93_00460 [Blautia sp. OF09-25XD]|nr:hypothetical protein DXA93_00460 [Blautia sp. OF09-25XD]